MTKENKEPELEKGLNKMYEKGYNDALDIIKVAMKENPNMDIESVIGLVKQMREAMNAK